MIRKKTLSSFSILLVLLIMIACITWIIPGNDVKKASLSMVTMAPVKGFMESIDVCIFVLILGGFLNVISYTGALDNGIKILVKKMNGNELKLIPILMLIFSIGGTTFGMLEETTPFYFLVVATMVAAGFDTLVGASIVLLGAGSGTLGSTVNPFAVGAAISSVTAENVEINNAIVIAVGFILWISSYLISVYFVMKYAKKVKANKDSTILSLQEQKKMSTSFGKVNSEEQLSLSKIQKIVLVLFGMSFFVMIIAFIPWTELGIDIFEGWTYHLTGMDFGHWYFGEASTWFLLMTILIAIIVKISEKKFINIFIDGASSMMSVVLIIALARGISVLMSPIYDGGTGLQLYILNHAVDFLEGVNATVFVPVSYFLYCLLSFLIPSSSGLATASMPIMGPLSSSLNFSPEVMIMIFVAANGLINLFTPTCGAIMGGFAIAKIEYSTWIKFSTKIIITIAFVSVVILTILMLVL